MNELKLPKIGLGTWMLAGDTCTNSVINGLEIGYQLIDTAQLYRNEAQVGNGICSSSISRKDIFLATKLGPTNLSPKKVHNSFKESMKKLQTDYVDILYIHWPFKFFYRPLKTLTAMNELVHEGLVNYIGVSNFPIYQLKEAMEISKSPIVANQVEMHPQLRQQKLHEFNQKHQVYTIAYSPLGRGKIWENEILIEIANKHNISVPQVCLVYLIKRGAIPIPKASTKEHLLANYKSLELDIDASDMIRIETIPEKRILNPPFAPKWDIDV